jgi:hypothetical protein
MPENQQPAPRKKQRSKAKKLNLSVKKRWQDIVKDVDKKEVPVEVLQRIVVKLIDGTDLSIDVNLLIREGNDPKDIETMLNAKFEELDSYIENVDFFIDIDSVVNAIQPETDKILKNI